MSRRLAALLGACAVMIMAPSPALACSSVPPSLDEITASAGAVVDGRVVATDDHGPPPWNQPYHFTIEVDRVLLGEASETVVVEVPSTICGDWMMADVGDRVIAAVNFVYHGHRVAPYWSMHRGRVRGTAVKPKGATSLDDVARYFARLPDTSTEHPQRDMAAPLAPLAVGGLALALYLARPLSRRRQLR